MRTEAAWKKRSRCRERGVDPDLFFVSDEEHRGKKVVLTAMEELAIAICKQCPVSGNCLAEALDRPDTKGIWGGTTTRMRTALRKVRIRASCPRCLRGRTHLVDDHTQVCRNCGLSWHWT